MNSRTEVRDESNGSRVSKCVSVDTFGLLYRIMDGILLFSVLSYQNCTLSYWLTYFNAENNFWYFFFFADFVLIFLFMSGAVFASRYYRTLHLQRHRLKESSSSNRSHEVIGSEKQQIFSIGFSKRFGKLPLLWICWVLYALLLSIKIFVLHLQNITLELHNSSKIRGSAYGLEVEPHTIKLCLATMTVVFLLWIELHRNHESNQSMECIKELTTTVVFEIFDSIDLLDLLLPESGESDSNLSERVSALVLVLVTINLLLPTIGLFRLSQSHFDSHKLGLRMNILHNCLRIVLVNIPYMLLRVSFWIAIKREISIFLLKNALFIFVSIRHIVSEFHQLKRLNQSRKQNQLALAVVSEDSIRKLDVSGDNPLEQQ